MPGWRGHPVLPAEFSVPLLPSEEISGRLFSPPPKDGILKTDIVEGLTKKQVLDILRSDWTGSISVPDAAMQARDDWEVTEPWPIARGRHYIHICFQNGLVEQIFEYWISN
jgi:hypothetical protein